ncbi:RING/U-box superfamily protein [Striga asiatica]|uniref:RING/U-box superfamily protein n=1 Tax=Striga asiatica TaxID=4170 RepID=A0A5A7R9L0_STRAF|nr:RING/U-box superfamily protein [Striga asiatica]
MVAGCDRRDIHRCQNTACGGAEAISARRLTALLWRLSATANEVTNGAGLELCSSIPIPNCPTEGATKWDYCNSKASHKTIYFLGNFRSMDPFNTKNCIATTKHSIKKATDEKMKTQHRKTSLMVENLKDGLKIERKNGKKVNMENWKLSRDVAEAKMSARKFMHNLEKEKKARKVLEDMFNKLAIEIEHYKVEIGALRSEREKIEEDVENERKIMQLAEVWKEEHAQKKLHDAKLILENKFCEMNNLISEIKSFLSESNSKRQSYDGVNIRGIRDFSHVLPKSNKIFTNKGENSCSKRSVYSNECPCGMETVNKTRKSNYKSNSFDLEREKFMHHGCRSSKSSGTSSVSLNRPKEKESLSSHKLQRELKRNKDARKKISSDLSGRISNCSVSSILSMDEGQVKLWKNPHVVRAMNGHIEWPGEIKKHGSSEGSFLEAKLKSQKTILRGVLKQRSLSSSFE